ncbi:MAG: transcription elongation factor GreA [Clostridia bacterium]|nr:transcription elongation factor GreA [Clostridia bacterium]MBR5427716.1 transcription elongation factor GreA [Clostridia bacterium]
MADEFILNAAGEEALRQELKELRTTGRADIAEKIKEAKSFGDLSENSEYDEAKSDQGKLEARIAEIEYMLAHVKIVDESSLTNDVVHVGSKVVVYDEEFDENLEYQIVGFAQADPLEGRISDDSPVGKALLGHKEGDVVEVEAPGGISSYKIVSISR